MKKVYFNFYKSAKKGVSIVVQGSNETKANQIAEDFKVEHEKSQEENARNFAIFLSNRKDIKVLNIKVVGKAWQVEAEIEDDETKQGACVSP